MAHSHNIIDTDTHFSINPVTRAIKNESSRKTTLIQYDHNSERFTFTLPRYIEGHDMSLCNKVEVHYFNIKEKTNSSVVQKGIYTVDDLHLSEDEEKVICSWLISENSTQFKGMLNFLLCYKCIEGGIKKYAWNTAFYTEITVSEGSDATESFKTDYVDIIEQWKAEVMKTFTDDIEAWEKDTKTAVNADIKAWEKEASANVDEKFNKHSTEWNQKLAVERARINQFTKLKEGSTTGDAELMDVRIGADGKVYKSAGDAVRTQLHKLGVFAESCVDTGMAELAKTYIANETNAGIDDCTIQGATPSQAYGNGTVFDNDVQILGIKMIPTMTATTFSVFVFDNSNNLVSSKTNIVPEIANGVFYLDDPVFVPAGGYMLMRFLDGVFFYKKIGASTLKEYQPGTGLLLDSPIKIGIEYIYEDIFQTVTFKDETVLPAIQLKDYTMPHFTANQNEKYTCFGRWFDYEVDGRIHKAANADGSSLAFRISGATKLNIGLYTIKDTEYTPYYAYSIDGSEFIRKKITDTSIPIADTGEHWVWIVIDGMGENDPVAGGKWYGTVGIYFGGITTDGTVCGVNSMNRQIMFIGDSIVEGINVLGAGANADTNSAINGFAFRTARMLNAIPLLCGYGGTAVLGNSSFHKPIEAVDFNLNGVPVNEQNPDIICIEHGYNDGTLVSNGTYTSDDFKAGYNALLNRIKIKYPGVQIVCLIPFKQSMKAEIVECVNGRSYCHIVDTEKWNVTYTDNAHPNEKGAILAAEKLSKEIVALFGKQYFM